MKDYLSSDELYLDLLKKCLTRSIFWETQYEIYHSQINSRKPLGFSLFRRFLNSKQLEIVRRKAFDLQARTEGKDWPTEAETMIGNKRLDNIQACVTDVLQRQVPGDLIETGVWRGGASIFMRAILKVYKDSTRQVWLADSFQGLPKPNPELYPKDQGDNLWSFPELAISLEHVKANFAKYGMLDDQVKFLVGWFRDTLPSIPADRFAVIRLDGDMYESTMDALRNLYPKLSVNGYVIIDDYGAIPACKEAVDDFRRQHSITDKMNPIDWTGVFWQRSRI